MTPSLDNLQYRIDQAFRLALVCKTTETESKYWALVNEIKHLDDYLVFENLQFPHERTCK